MHSYLGHGAVIRPKHTRDCSRRQVCLCLFLVACWTRLSMFMPGNFRVKLPNINYAVT